VTPAEALETRVTFGRYKGLTWGEIVDRDPGYVRWACDASFMLDDHPDLVDALAELVFEEDG